MLHARKANFSVIFRKGPAKWTQVLKWNTETDKIIAGQWFKGSFYPGKSDLSPYGNYLIYFAAKFKDETNKYAWTAISKPPYLTAIALWKQNDTFDGGGLFESTRKIYLNINKEDAKPEIFPESQGLKITYKGSKTFFRNDIEAARMRRDHWKWSNDKTKNLQKADVQITKQIKDFSIIHLGKRKATNFEYSWNSFIDYRGELLNFDGYKNMEVTQNGRIVLTRDGCIYSIDDLGNYLSTKKMKLVADLNANKPYEMVAPADMTKW